ncbi:MAG: TraB/GumN family protein [Bacteroidia bacterium]
MRIYLIGVFIGLFCWQLSGFAQETEYNSLLWEIKGNGLKQTSYLYGTIHVIPKDSFFIDAPVSKRLKKADRLVMEMKLNMGAMISAMRAMMLPKDQSLDQFLSVEEMAAVRSFMLDSISQPLPTFERIKPLMISEHFSSQYCMGAKQESYEMYFSRQFKKMKKPISGLETAKEQMKYLDGVTMDDQIEGLLQIVNSPEEVCEQYDQMLALYRQQRLGDLLTMTMGEETMEESLEGLLYERNRNWIPQLEKMMRKESVFIAVGAAHLPGEKGVIELLRAAGYKLRPISK